MTKEKALAKLFGAPVHVTMEGFAVTYSKYDDKAINFQTLEEVMRIMECLPSELFWGPDLDTSSCFYPGDTPSLVMEFIIRRKK